MSLREPAHVEIFTNYIGSIGTLSRTTPFIRRTSTKLSEFLKIAERNKG
jgi:hypothetical protein